MLPKSILRFTNTDIHGPWDTLPISAVDHRSLFQSELSAIIFNILEWKCICVSVSGCVCLLKRQKSIEYADMVTLLTIRKKGWLMLNLVFDPGCVCVCVRVCVRGRSNE